ncbi:MAG: hypothetical protein RPV21_16665 [Candidatus Sedimenticola sp. (ex Thyasira tokunagai)]
MKKALKYLLLGILTIGVLIVGTSYFYLSYTAENTIVNDPNAYPLFLPPPIKGELLELRNTMRKRGGLVEQEMIRYRELDKKRMSTWSNQPTVGQFLIPIKVDRERNLREELQRRNIEQTEIDNFIGLVRMDFSKILRDESEFIWVINTEGEHGAEKRL